MDTVEQVLDGLIRHLVARRIKAWECCEVLASADARFFQLSVQAPDGHHWYDKKSKRTFTRLSLGESLSVAADVAVLQSLLHSMVEDAVKALDELGDPLPDRSFEEKT